MTHTSKYVDVIPDSCARVAHPRRRGITFGRHLLAFASFDIDDVHGVVDRLPRLDLPTSSEPTQTVFKLSM